MTVKTDRGLAHYVTKFFARQDIRQQNALCREVYTGALAKKLGLGTPDFALITVDDAFRETLTDEMSDQLDHKHSQFGFGSKFIPGKHTYTPALLNKELDSYDIASIFAFDVLVFNADRREQKPNILLDNDRYYLIDHEHTFALAEDANPRQRLSKYHFTHHIFYDVLNRKARYGHEPEFAIFQELFHRLNLDILDNYAGELQIKGYDNGDSVVIKRYLKELKRDISYFMNIVKGGIQ